MPVFSLTQRRQDREEKKLLKKTYADTLFSQRSHRTKDAEGFLRLYVIMPHFFSRTFSRAFSKTSDGTGKSFCFSMISKNREISIGSN